MRKSLLSKSYLPVLILTAALSLSFNAQAQRTQHESDHDDHIVIRQTIPNPGAVQRGPITSDQLSTTSTRYIDARRGFRPYSSVGHDRHAHRYYRGYDDHFGISRPENRPYSYSQRTPRTYVEQFRNDHADKASSRDNQSEAAAMTIILRDERQAEAKADKPDMTIRVHKDKTAIPTTTGAVLITADGTVIQIGD